MSNLPFITASIKTFNEARGIEKTIDSIRRQLTAYPHEIIVADSLSTDNTRELAGAKGATVVTLVHPQERCCGVGHQLGYLHSQGDYLLLMDGDMELEDGFLDAAVAFLQTHPDYAGVAGSVQMDEGSNYEFKSRKQRLHKIYPLGDTDHLGGGGLYRRSAIEKIGYLTHRGLHGYEEAELGIRLRQAGYKLRRLDVPYFSHTSHAMPTLQMLRYRWRSRFLSGPGELLRSAWGKPWFRDALKITRNEAIFTLYLLALLLALVSGHGAAFAIVLLPLILFILLKAVKNRSLIAGLHSVVNLAAFSAGLIRGLFTPLRDPLQPPESEVVYRQGVEK
ncbi:glycosyltransferase family 2 protein [Enterobacillus tribolii]|uniref:Glycosyl transferase family 2 n=1 Tax=Enterobacillus tribolii TaxID=1487935 RepID=A0A370QPU5_9GAMM|nr:glycosyltransferase [Enterobacillus tribolii]MBW7981437.1 glycosyltransferase [Enterobacillus tribolii]RDK90813.1 glycosyl transferase family 2 [Enterobacillus tribolii]